MGLKKELKMKKNQAEKNTGEEPENNSGSPTRTEQPDLSHLSGDWQEFYRLVIDRIS